MNRAVLISIRPEWCDRIANGMKTVEVRKSRPKLETPFKCYVYCTLPRKSGDAFLVGGMHPLTANGTVIGEFSCDRIYQYSTANVKGIDISDEDMENMSCLSHMELEEYELSAEAKDFEVYNVGLYGWHISRLKIWDKPKELSEFYTEGDRHKPITRAPQSWRYVEEL